METPEEPAWFHLLREPTELPGHWQGRKEAKPWEDVEKGIGLFAGPAWRLIPAARRSA